MTAGSKMPDLSFAGDGRLARVERWLTELRADTTWRVGALVCATVVGLGFAWFHWVGLVVAGALVGLTRRRVRGALVAGAMVGLVAVGLTIVLAPVISPDAFATLTPVNYVTVGLGLILPVWGSLARYVV